MKDFLEFVNKFNAPTLEQRIQLAKAEMINGVEWYDNLIPTSKDLFSANGKDNFTIDDEGYINVTIPNDFSGTSYNFAWLSASSVGLKENTKYKYIIDVKENTLTYQVFLNEGDSTGANSCWNIPIDIKSGFVGNVSYDVTSVSTLTNKNIIRCYVYATTTQQSTKPLTGHIRFKITIVEDIEPTVGDNVIDIFDVLKQSEHPTLKNKASEIILKSLFNFNEESVSSFSLRREIYTREELESKTVAELKELCRSNNISGYSSLTKAQLVDLLLANEVIK